MEQEKPKRVGYESHLASPGTLMFDVPNPVEGCDECAEFAKEWAGAMRRFLETGEQNPAYDPTRATDAIVLMRRHKEATHGEAIP